MCSNTSEEISGSQRARIMQTREETNTEASSTARRPRKTLALASAGAELRLVNGVTLLAKFDGEFARGSQTYAGTGTIRYAW